MIKAVIFDMDGVLIDSEPVYMDYVLQIIEKMCQSKNYQFDYENMKQHLYPLVGSPNQKTYQIISDCLEHVFTVGEIKHYFVQDYQDIEPIDFRTIINPHLLFILPKLKEMGLKLAIASSSPLEDIKKVIQQCDIAKYFDTITSGLEFKESKPNPEIYNVTMEKLSVSKEEVIAIEDSTYGIEACYNAGVKVIGKIDHRFGFDQSKADFKVYDLLEAYHIIKQNKGT